METKRQSVKQKKFSPRLLFYITGIGAVVWFLIRVIPKPSRASYPCMRAAFPVASGFVIYLFTLFTSAFAINKLKIHWKMGHSKLAAIFLFVVIVCGFLVLQSDKPYSYANFKSTVEDPNQPMGVGKGIFPGCVVWVRDSNAVDQTCKNSYNDYWWQDDNVNQTEVNNMVSKALQTLTGKESDADAWDAIFRYYNATHGRGDVGYQSGEKIVIKINLNNGASGNSYTRQDDKPVDTSPQIVYAVLDQLINVAGVAQADIGFGDPGRNIDKIFWDKFHSIFPNVKYWGNGNGRTPIVQSAKPELKLSDGTMENYLPVCYLEATYIINIPILKQHHRAGISLTSKNHFGTFVPFLGNAFPLHYSLPCTEGDGNVNNGGYHQYRIFVDFIGHKDIGGKTILYLVDGLWSSTNWGDPPWKWRMTPFNNSYPASIFVSQDPVAIESVGFDFLFAEFYIGNPSHNEFPHYSGVDDFLHQAADSLNWPADILYDPEGDGTNLPRSMGVHEHWNNENDKQYSRNLGKDEGIELVSIKQITGVNESGSLKYPSNFYLYDNYPNPFNPSTVISYQLSKSGHVELKVFDPVGKEIETLVNKVQNAGVYKVVFKANNLSSGTYFYRIRTGNLEESKKMVLIR